MVNSNVPHLRNLVSVSCTESIVQVKILILSSVLLNKHMMAPLSALCEQIVNKLDHLNSHSYHGEIVQLQSSLNDDYNKISGKIKHVPHFKANNWKIFSKPFTSFTSESLINVIYIQYHLRSIFIVNVIYVYF